MPVPAGSAADGERRRRIEYLSSRLFHQPADGLNTFLIAYSASAPRPATSMAPASDRGVQTRAKARDFVFPGYRRPRPARRPSSSRCKRRIDCLRICPAAGATVH